MRKAGSGGFRTGELREMTGIFRGPGRQFFLKLDMKRHLLPTNDGWVFDASLQKLDETSEVLFERTPSSLDASICPPDPEPAGWRFIEPDDYISKTVPFSKDEITTVPVADIQCPKNLVRSCFEDEPSVGDEKVGVPILSLPYNRLVTINSYNFTRFVC